MSLKNLIFERIKKFEEIIPQGVQLVAVSKFQPIEAVEYAYNAGQRIFGESRVQEFLEKKSRLPEDIQWHFIGHLQTNKVRSLIGKITLIESVDSTRLLELIDKESGKAGIITRILLQVHVAEEETKFGFSLEELIELIKSGLYKSYGNLSICGLMGMATNTDDEERIRRDFMTIANLFRDIKGMTPDLEEFEILSMGMSGDWPLAVEAGSNMIRIGSSLFGPRS